MQSSVFIFNLQTVIEAVKLFHLASLNRLIVPKNRKCFLCQQTNLGEARLRPFMLETLLSRNQLSGQLHCKKILGCKRLDVFKALNGFRY